MNLVARDELACSRYRDVTFGFIILGDDLDLDLVLHLVQFFGLQLGPLELELTTERKIAR